MSSVLIAVAALPCGLLIGLLLGALGGGGSVLAVPVLVYLLGQSPHAATTGALVVVAVGAVSGLVCHARAGRVRWGAGAVFGALGTAGSFAGSRWSAALDPTALMAAFSGLLLVVAAGMALRGARGSTPGRAGRWLRRLRVPLRRLRVPARPSGARARPVRAEERSPGAEERPLRAGAPPLRVRGHPLGTHRPQPRGHDQPRDHDQAPRNRPRPLRIIVTASSVGLLTGFFGVGGGFVVVPALTLVLGLEMPVAVGTSLLVILINSGAALATRVGTGSVDWPLLATLAACAATGSHLGNRLAGRLRPQALTASFAALVTVLALAMAATTLPAL
ncbi:sulfite exporter TauE/SafE family protein [Streptomyces sp. RS10V-4]|uniref:sulfite exporter TauE/SafE family protein n=1 Tax=Streptomyces rhizoryzae TaxID=2932493 RepID=UPI0020060700|nr:sulfite exporter TauE/SafE family protein [Streptomyces rhizoryzae]MCK7624914.1 sulfite exporter TauE/SafE family protein [Streptomyces rhizoryzae]